jgi:probable phosphoglycerate mutase
MEDVTSPDAPTAREVVLIRHAEPVVDAHVLPEIWELSNAGRAAARRFASRLARVGLDRLVTSPEVKAVQTAEILASTLGVTLGVDPRLHEVRRPWMPAHPRREVGRYLEGASLEGWEPLEVVRRRVATALGDAGEDLVGFVTHGTAMAALFAGSDVVDAWRFWCELRMPDAFRVSGASLTRL